ncbi:hypothetical protein XELAEV_18017206mg [Xenopus laevis]|uniref:Uncharacterized protein n=1 Tax=Xenopus laevis TaxID=8355 RepID=A0A974HS73_XENLA|nr:hypothetical protein XELAEV_18017206mg [Xenopus laevis]
MTFAYTDEDITRITGMIGQTDNFLNQPDIMIDFKELEKTKRKFIAYELHAQTLGEYVKCKRIPRGLRSHLRPTMFSNNEQFCNKWEAILNKCSIDLMVAIIEEIHKELPKVSQSGNEMETKLRNQASPQVFTEGKRKLADHLQSFRMELQARKRTKFQRDAADYEEGAVYRWETNRNDRGGFQGRDPRGFCNKPREMRRIRASTETSDSQDTSLPFLGGSQSSLTADPEDANEGAASTARNKQHRQYKRRRMRW